MADFDMEKRGKNRIPENEEGESKKDRVKGRVRK